MKFVIGAAMIALALGGANTAAAQTPQARIDAAMAKAKAAGIPVALLESKIAEGRAKGVSMDRIAAAVERREAALERASSVLRGPRAVDEDGLDVGADAVEQGISEAVLAAIADAAPRERRSVAIAALTELVARGRSSQNALDQVRAAVKKGPEALANLPAQAAAADNRRGGGPPETSPGAGRGRGGTDAAPPAAVPAPGGSPQPARPGGPPETPGRPTDPGRGRGGTDAAPPAAVPAPGGSPQPGRPGGPPETPGRPTDPGRGRGGA